MTHIEALKMALELLAVATYHSPDLQAKRTEVIDVGLKALAQPRQNEFKPDYNTEAVLVEEMQRMAKRIEELEADEVRDHMDSVGCGTIYKTAGEGLVPLCVANPTPPECETEAEKIAFAHGWWKALEVKAQPQGKHTFYDAHGNVVAHLDATAEITMDYAKPSVWAKAEQPPVAKPHEQEPMATLWQHGETGRTRITMPNDITDCDARWFKAADLYTSPPQRTWVKLTDDERNQIWYTVGNADPHGDVDGWSGRDVMDAIEAKLKAKNEL